MTTRLIALDATLPMRIEVRGKGRARDARIERAWEHACATNPRLFDGDILAVRGIDSAASVVHASPDRFSHVVCPVPGVSQRVTILSVTGVIEAMLDGLACVLMGRRGACTRSYPGMWEFAPAGGLHSVQAPASLGLEQVLSTLTCELAEEAGINAPLEGVRAVALVADAEADSVDVIVRARLAGEAPGPAPGGAHEWEYSCLRWVPLDGFGAFAASEPGGMIEPTLVVARWLGWLS
ncbi:MAG: NUDIX hydrolase [Phycisphaeraceae bacterium]|nr:NUDIX hydrolase [Phycisphaeraceae bacterium]